jgi:hypothetical protein
MKNKILVISAFLLTVLVCGGCDMFRALAGRPTSSDIEAMRVEIAARVAAEAARQDSLERAAREAEAAAARSAAALDTLLAMRGYLRTPASLGGLTDEGGPSAKYSIVIGSYLDKANAVKYSGKLTADGYPAEAVRFRNRFTAVCVCPTDDPAEILASLRRVKKEKFCPKEVWILVNE